MPNEDEFFTPADVDEQIDLLARESGTSSEASQATEHLISHLRQYYTQNAHEQLDPLERAWKRIVAEHESRPQTLQRKGRLIHMQDYKNKNQTSPTLHKRRTLAQRLGLLVAILFVGLLVGGMLFVLNTGRQNLANKKQPVITGSGGTPQPKPPHPITGGKCTLDTTKTSPQKSQVSLPGLYVFGMYEQSNQLLYRYDPQTKKVIWSIKFCDAFEADGTFEQNGILYLAGADFTHESDSGTISYLYALNESDGSPLWGIQFPTKVVPFQKDSPNYGSSPLDLGMIEMPTLANGIIYVVQRSGIVYAFDAKTGGQLWTFDSGRNVWATTSRGNGAILDASSVQVVNGIAYFEIVDRVFALGPKTGRELWMHSFNNALNINQSLAIDNNTVYLTAFVPGYGSVVHPDTYIYAFDAQTGAQKWVSAKLTGYLDAPIASNGNLAVASYDGLWYILDPATGAVKAQRALVGGVYSNLTLISGVLYDLTTKEADNTLAVLNPNGSVKWSVQVSGKYPVVEDAKGGVIYISGRGTGIYAYSASDGKLLWHYGGYLMQPDGISLVTVVP